MTTNTLYKYSGKTIVTDFPLNLKYTVEASQRRSSSAHCTRCHEHFVKLFLQYVADTGRATVAVTCQASQPGDPG